MRQPDAEKHFPFSSERLSISSMSIRTIIKRRSANHLRFLWITPLRALAKDIGRAMKEVIEELGMQWKIGIRNGDTEISERRKTKKTNAGSADHYAGKSAFITGPKSYPEIFKALKILAVDEWHELLGSKRGVQVELAVSRIVQVVASYQQPFPDADEINASPHLPFRDALEKTLKSKDEKFPFSVWGISATIGNLEQAKEYCCIPCWEECMRRR